MPVAAPAAFLSSLSNGDVPPTAPRHYSNKTIVLHGSRHSQGFNHRGQAHSCLSILTGAEPPPRDLLLFQRGAPSRDLTKLIPRRG